MNLLFSTFKKSLKAGPFVLKKVSVYFGFYFLALSFLLLLSLQSYLFTEGHSGLSSEKLIQGGLVFFSKIFTVFMVPYYTFKYNGEGANKKFWDFIRDNIWPLVINHIKAFFVILLFLLLLIVPGIYKIIRLTFLTETVFFDEKYKESSVSALKQADKVTRGRFWLIICFFIIWIGFNILFSLIPLDFLPYPLKSFFLLIINFYMSCFLLLVKTQFYFELKKEKAEALSL